MFPKNMIFGHDAKYHFLEHPKMSLFCVIQKHHFSTSPKVDVAREDDFGRARATRNLVTAKHDRARSRAHINF
jgi:hypothetical protein